MHDNACAQISSTFFLVVASGSCIDRQYEKEVGSSNKLPFAMKTIKYWQCRALQANGPIQNVDSESMLTRMDPAQQLGKFKVNTRCLCDRLCNGFGKQLLQHARIYI